MKKSYLFFILFCVSSTFCFGQNKIEKLRKETLEIAYILYESELASWHSTDLLNYEYPHILEKIGGYLSYTENDTTKSIYYSKENTEEVLFEVDYENIKALKDVFDIDTIPRKLSK